MSIVRVVPGVPHAHLELSNKLRFANGFPLDEANSECTHKPPDLIIPASQKP
jgi:hypothetical protein